MATYMELHALGGGDGSDLQDRVQVACIVAAEAVRSDASPPENQADREAWARRAFTSPTTVAVQMLWALLAVHKDQAVEQITTAADSVIQDAVDAAVDLFAVPGS